MNPRNLDILELNALIIETRELEKDLIRSLEGYRKIKMDGLLYKIGVKFFIWQIQLNLIRCRRSQRRIGRLIHLVKGQV